MSRGRKPDPTPEAQADSLNREALREDSAALTEMGRRSAEVAERYGDGLPYDRNRLVAEARFYMGQSAEAMLEAGKRLVQIKENEEHGEFTRILENSLGLSARTARAMMQAAIRYLSPALLEKRQAPAVLGLGRAKLLDLLAEPDEAIEALADGGTVAGLDLDEIAALSTRELREALRKERAERAKDAKAKQKVIDGKESKITALEEKLARRADPEEKEATQLQDLSGTGSHAVIAIRQLMVAAGSVISDPANEATAHAANNAVSYVAKLFAGLCHEAGVSVDFEADVTPIWLDGVKEAADAHFAARAERAAARKKR